MGIRDIEFKRLVLYAKSLGLKVTIFNRKNPNMEAYWTTDGKELGIYCGSKVNKTELILTIIHELGHHLHYVREKKRKTPIKLDKAWDKENKSQLLSEFERKMILEDELAGTEFWDSICKDINIKIPKWRIEMQKEIDMLPYEFYFKTGDYPRGKTKEELIRKIKEKWKNLK